MTIGSGIAVAAMWGSVVAALFAPDLNEDVRVTMILAALGGTYLFSWRGR